MNQSQSFFIKRISTILLIFSIGLFMSCEAEDPKPEDPCEGVVCNNAGICFDGNCVCKEGYSGSTCNTRIDPSEVRIERIKIIRFPAKQTNGSDWDITSTGRPDLWIRVYRSTTKLHEQPGSSAISNAISTDNNIYTPSNSIVLTLEDSEHTIRLYDYDGDPNSNAPDFMGEVDFTPFLSSRPGFPSTLVIDQSGLVAFELSLSYGF